MARRYEALSDEDLNARIDRFNTAIEELAGGGEVAGVQESGRRMEYTRGNAGDAERILNLLLDEKEMRANGGRLPGRALGMRFYRA